MTAENKEQDPIAEGRDHVMADASFNNEIRWQIIEHTRDVDPLVWGSLHPQSGAFLCLDYLSALEEAHDEGLEVRMAIFFRGKTPVGIAAFQIAHFMTSEDAYSNVFLRKLNALARCIRGKHIHNILISGNAFATGEHGFTFSDDVSMDVIAKSLRGAMDAIAKLEQAKGRRICAMVTKDFYPGLEPVAESLEKYRFKRFQVDHNMVMPVLPEWQSFNDYLETLNTKFRTKAKATLKRSAALEVRSASAEDINEHAAVLQQLYENVYEKADFRLGKLNVRTLAGLRARIPGQFSVNLYFLEGKLVGFMSAMRCGQVLEAHVIGIDYEVNRDHGVYQRMLYDYVALAIELRCTRIVYGRTAAEIKSTVGAFPVNLTCSIKHRRSISNALLRLIIQYVVPSEYPQRQPFKAEVQEALMKIPLYQTPAHAAKK
ncbi:MAG: GNAT family N-acetyltransferase [Flavobacteriales bacterium]